MKEIIKTGDESLDKWIVFFNNKKFSNTKFINLLNKLDKTYLTETPSSLSTFEYPDNGLLEDIFKKVLFEDSAKNPDNKASIVIALIKNVNYKPWLNIYGDRFRDALEKSIIEGNYEEYGFTPQEALKIAIQKDYLIKEQFVEISLMRGFILGNRYPNKEDESKLKNKIKRNKLKMFFNL